MQTKAEQEMVTCLLFADNRRKHCAGKERTNIEGVIANVLFLISRFVTRLCCAVS
jgi:hypothetical protein